MSKQAALEQPELSAFPDAASDPPLSDDLSAQSDAAPALDAERIANMAEAILFQLIDQRHGSYEAGSTVGMAFTYAIEFERRRLALPGN